MVYQATVAFVVRLSGYAGDVAFRGSSEPDWIYNIGFSPSSDVVDLKALESYTPPSSSVIPNQAICCGWASSALVSAGLDSDWQIDLDPTHAKPGHTSGGGGWVDQPGTAAFTAYCFPILRNDGVRPTNLQVGSQMVLVDYWLVVQPAS
jgi:hypothetical protein